MQQLLKALRTRLKPLLNSPAPTYQPVLTDATLVETVLPTSPLLHAAQAAWRAGDRTSARRWLVDHFIERRSPKFFCDTENVSGLVDTIRTTHPAWLAAMRARVEADLTVGLGVASTRAKPLEDGFDWTCIPYGPGEDDLYSVQPHRCGFMPRLALMAHHGMPTPTVILSILDYWITVTKAGNRMSYLSPLVVLYRVLSLGWTFAFIAGLHAERSALHYETLFRILKILHADIDYLRTTIGHSYPNNHLLADGFAGWYCGTLYPEFSGSDAMRETGSTIFEREIVRQFYEDGAGFEHSMHYHELGCEMAIAYVILERRNGIEPAAFVVERLHRMLAFQAAMGGAECVPLTLGDTTEDPLFPLDATHGWGTGAIREIYRALVDPRIEPAPNSDPTIERAYWLLGGALAPYGHGTPGSLPTSFDRGGYYILAEPGACTRLVFRSGPLEGVPLSAGHAHSDILSIYLTVDGIPLLVNAGTYTYRFQSRNWPAHAPEWRKYFMGPESHNGLALGADPYGTLKGDFRDRDVPCRIASRHRIERSELRWLEFEVMGSNTAQGYRRGIIHIVGHYWLIYDLVPDAARVRGASIGLQFSPETQLATAIGTAFQARAGTAWCRIALGPGLHDSRILTGSTNPLGGWVSPSYGELLSAPQLRCRIAPDAEPCAFIIQSSRTTSALSIVSATRMNSWLAFRIEGDNLVDVLLVRVVQDSIPMSAWDVHADGDFAWVRIRQGTAAECRSTQATLVKHGSATLTGTK